MANPNVGFFDTMFHVEDDVVAEQHNAKKWAMISRDWAVSPDLVDSSEELGSVDYSSKHYYQLAESYRQQTQLQYERFMKYYNLITGG